MKKLFLLAALFLSVFAASTSPAHAQGDWPEYTPGMHHRVGIRGLQRLLVARNYRVATDGVYGKQTTAALRRFQRSRGLRAHGMASPETWRALVPKLQRGAKGQAVRALQEQLSFLGFATKPDGVFGAGTERTVKRFQRQADIVEDGIVGTQTWRVLAMEVALRYEH